jgi:hypothetical protein
MQQDLTLEGECDEDKRLVEVPLMLYVRIG